MFFLKTFGWLNKQTDLWCVKVSRFLLWCDLSYFWTGQDIEAIASLKGLLYKLMSLYRIIVSRYADDVVIYLTETYITCEVTFLLSGVTQDTRWMGGLPEPKSRTLLDRADIGTERTFHNKQAYRRLCWLERRNWGHPKLGQRPHGQETLGNGARAKHMKLTRKTWEHWDTDADDHQTNRQKLHPHYYVFCFKI